ncbi:unnamed protein product, partial [Didymodactylos carnosus]
MLEIHTQNNPTFRMLAPPRVVMSQFHIYDSEVLILVLELLSNLDTGKSCSPYYISSTRIVQHQTIHVAISYRRRRKMAFDCPLTGLLLLT